MVLYKSEIEKMGLQINFGRARKRDKNEAGTGSKIGLTLFFLVFFLMGSFFEVLVAKEFLARAQRYTWKTRSCTIQHSQVAETNTNKTPYIFIVQYHY